MNLVLRMKQLSSLRKGNMTICSPSQPWAILPALGEHSVILPSYKGINCILYLVLFLLEIQYCKKIEDTY